jgi:hypothetical protein
MQFGEAVRALLLRQADFADQFGVTWIGAQRIEREVAPETDQRDIVSLEGMTVVCRAAGPRSIRVLTIARLS